MAKPFAKTLTEVLDVPSDLRVTNISVQSNDGVESVVVETEKRPVESKTLATVTVQR